MVRLTPYLNSWLERKTLTLFSLSTRQVSMCLLMRVTLLNL